MLLYSYSNEKEVLYQFRCIKNLSATKRLDFDLSI